MTDSELVLVVDDDPSIRDALRSLIRSLGLRCETFASADELLSYTRPATAACVVLDVQFPGRSGLDLVPDLRRAGIDMPIIFLTGHGTIPMSVRAMKTGAIEFLTKPFSEDALIASITHALDRDRASLATRAEHEALRRRFDQLTPREREVFARVVEGRMNKQIAAELGIVEQTIKQHRGKVMQKLGVESVAELVRFAEHLSLPLERSRHPTNVE